MPILPAKSQFRNRNILNSSSKYKILFTSEYIHFQIEWNALSTADFSGKCSKEKTFTNRIYIITYKVIICMNY